MNIRQLQDKIARSPLWCVVALVLLLVAYPDGAGISKETPNHVPPLGGQKIIALGWFL